jgi:HPr kinase/phosphorylase
MLGKKVPHIELFVRPGRDIARLVEVAALTQALKKMGHDPAQEFNNRLIAAMAEQASAPATKIKPVEREESPDDAKPVASSGSFSEWRSAMRPLPLAP